METVLGGPLTYGIEAGVGSGAPAQALQIRQQQPVAGQERGGKMRQQRVPPETGAAQVSVQEDHVGAAGGGLLPPLYSDKEVARLLVRVVHRQAGLAAAVGPFDGGGGSPCGALLVQAVLAAGAHQGAAPRPGGSQRQAPCRGTGKKLF